MTAVFYKFQYGGSLLYFSRDIDSTNGRQVWQKKAYIYSHLYAQERHLIIERKRRTMDSTFPCSTTMLASACSTAETAFPRSMTSSTFMIMASSSLYFLTVTIITLACSSAAMTSTASTATSAKTATFYNGRRSSLLNLRGGICSSTKIISWIKQTKGIIIRIIVAYRFCFSIPIFVPATYI